MQDFTTLWLLQPYFGQLSCMCVLTEIYLTQWVTLPTFYLGGRGSLIVHARTTWLHALCTKIAVHIFMPGLWKQVLHNEWLFKTCSKCGSLIASQSSMHVYKLEDLELKICLWGFLYEDILISCLVLHICYIPVQGCLGCIIMTKVPGNSYILRKNWLK